MQRFFLFLMVCMAAAGAMARYTVELDAPAEVKELLSRHLDIYRWRDEAKFDNEGLPVLVERVSGDATSLLSTAGYFSPQIQARLDTAATPPKVIIKVETGEPTRFCRIDFQLKGEIEEDVAREHRLRTQIENNWQLKPDAPFNQSAWNDAKRRTLLALQASRYPAARIEKSEVKVDPQLHCAEATLIADSGPLYHYGEIKVEGVSRYPERIVTDLIDFKAGDIYRRYHLLDLQSEIEALPYFGGATVEAIPSDAPPWLVPVTVRVQEVPLQRIAFGIGYSTTAGARGSASYAYNNLFNRGWVFDSSMSLARDTQQLEAGVTLPQHSSGYSHRVYGEIKHENVENLETRSQKLGVSRSITHVNNGIDRTITFEYLTETRDRGSGEIDRLGALTGNYRWLRRNLDSQRDPRRGNLLQLEGGGAVKELLSDQTFVRLYGRGQQYLPFADKGVLIARLELGHTVANDATKVPTAWLFRAGGAGSVRGYDNQSLGTQADDGTVLPVQAIMTASLEAQYPVYKDWRGAVFVDYGDAAASFSALKPVTGAGAGARWASPVGVVGADLAYGFARKQTRFYFSLGMAF